MQAAAAALKGAEVDANQADENEQGSSPSPSFAAFSGNDLGHLSLNLCYPPKELRATLDRTNMREALVVTDVRSAVHSQCPSTNYEPASTWEAFIVPLLRRRIEWALRTCASAPPEGGRVLDVGCGRQPFRAHLESLGYHYVGLDVEQNPEGTVAFQAPIDDPMPFGLRELGPLPPDPLHGSARACSGLGDGVCKLRRSVRTLRGSW